MRLSTNARISAPSVAASSLTPRSSTDWLSIGIPASMKRAQATRVELGGRERRPAAWPDLLAPEAEPAIDRADVHELQQHAVGIAVHDAGDRAVCVVADRIGALRRRGHELSRIGHELACDRVARI